MRARLLLIGTTVTLLCLLGSVVYWGARHYDAREPHAIERIDPLVGSGQSYPNVILVLLDTVRADHLGVYGRQPDPAPFLSALATESAVFDRAFSVSSWTAPATASVFTGQYPWRHGILDGFFWHQRQMNQAKAADAPVIAINAFSSDTRTMPERFRDLGYATVGLASNINIGNEIGFDRGFDRFVRHDAHARGKAGYFHARLEDWATDLRAAAPYFLYLHLNDAHQPYVRRYPYHQNVTSGDAGAIPQAREDSRARYLSEISYIDAQIEKIFHMGIRDDDTLFVVLSDHGEEFGDHGGSGHKGGLHSELNRVVMIMHGPAQGIRGTRVADVNVSQIDVLPTLLDLVGAPVPTELEGRSLAPLLRPGAQSQRLEEELLHRVLFAHRRGASDWFAAVDGPWKLIRNDPAPYQLFNLRSDPNEKTDLLSQEEVVVDRLKPLLARFDDESLWKHGDVSTVQAGDALEEQLRSLGYIR